MKLLLNNGYLMIVITAVAWSGNAIAARAVHEAVPPIGLAFWRWVATVPIFLVLAWPHLKRDIPEALANWKILVVLSVLSVSIYNSFLYIGLNSTTATNSFLINTSRPVIIVILSLIILRLAVTGQQAAGLALGLVGTAVIVARGDPGVVAALDFVPGDLWILAATLSWALYTVYLRRRPKIRLASFMFLTAIIGLAVLAPFYWWEHVYVRPVPLAPETFWAVAYLSVVASVIAYMAYNRAVEILGPNVAGLTSYLLPVFGVTLAILLLGESFRLFHAVGIALLLTGVYLATRAKG
ncbi:MAG: DMT family transporter [Rhodospirillales bacterium]|nr:DMT family transporter [Rhodospirillales bacterium]